MRTVPPTITNTCFAYSTASSFVPGQKALRGPDAFLLQDTPVPPQSRSFASLGASLFAPNCVSDRERLETLALRHKEIDAARSLATLAHRENNIQIIIQLMESLPSYHLSYVESVAFSNKLTDALIDFIQQQHDILLLLKLCSTVEETDLSVNDKRRVTKALTQCLLKDREGFWNACTNQANAVQSHFRSLVELQLNYSEVKGILFEYENIDDNAILRLIMEKLGVPTEFFDSISNMDKMYNIAEILNDIERCEGPKRVLAAAACPLVELRLDGTRDADQLTTVLKQLKHLPSVFSIEGAPNFLNDSHIEILASLPLQHLYLLDIRGSEVSNIAPFIKQFPALKQLCLHGTYLEYWDLDELNEKRPDIELLDN